MHIRRYVQTLLSPPSVMIPKYQMLVCSHRVLLQIQLSVVVEMVEKVEWSQSLTIEMRCMCVNGWAWKM